MPHSLLAFALAAALAAAPDRAAAQESAGANAAAARLPAVSVTTVVLTPLVERVHASGLIGPVEQVFVQPQIEGQAIETIDAEVGDWVERGQPLAQLSDAALQLERSQLDATRASAEAAIAQSAAQLAEAEAVRDEALRERDRAVQLAERGATSEAAADTARASAATAQARVNAATQALNAARAQVNLVDAQIADVELRLQRTAVKAPVSGRVTDRGAAIGAIANMASDPLFSITRDGALELRADVAGSDVLKLQPGMRAHVRVVGLDSPTSGAIRLVEPTVDAASRLGRVRIAIDEPERVRVGMFAEAEIEVRAAEALAVPLSAVGVGPDGASVLRVRDGLVEAVPIVVGIRDGGRVEIVDGLEPGDTVVAKAGAFVRDGDRINPVPAETVGVSN